MFNIPWRSTNVLQGFPLCLLLLILLNTRESLNPNPKDSLLYEENTLWITLCTIRSKTHGNFDSASVCKHNMHSKSPIHCPPNSNKTRSQCMNDVLLQQMTAHLFYCNYLTVQHVSWDRGGGAGQQKFSGNNKTRICGLKCGNIFQSIWKRKRKGERFSFVG